MQLLQKWTLRPMCVERRRKYFKKCGPNGDPLLRPHTLIGNLECLELIHLSTDPTRKRGEKKRISNGYFSHTRRLKAHDHCNLRALIGRKGGDRLSSLCTRRWTPKGLKQTSWMKKVYMESSMTDYGHGFMVSHTFCQTHLQEAGLTKISGNQWIFIILNPSG